MKKENNITFGKQGESIAESFLKKNGYKIITTNFRTKIGEIDIIAKDKDYLCFIEVKTRKSFRFGDPAEAIDKKKMHKISQIAQLYLKKNKIYGCLCRFDVVTAVVSGNCPVHLKLYKNAFRIDTAYEQN
ncbi:MAG: YraN family protein [Candidatus Omnitrophota bacterium]